jgi:mRNA-degrading endonuclease RelE of RelBE toxin-antitoxin system
LASRKLRVPEEIRLAISQLPPETKRKVRAALTAVTTDPTIGEPLRDRLAGYRRIRIGRWRVVYRERARLIDVAIVGPRVSVYADLLEKLGSE